MTGIRRRKGANPDGSHSETAPLVQSEERWVSGEEEFLEGDADDWWIVEKWREFVELMVLLRQFVPSFSMVFEYIRQTWYVKRDTDSPTINEAWVN